MEFDGLIKKIILYPQVKPTMTMVITMPNKWSRKP